MFMHGVCAALMGFNISFPAWHLTACRSGGKGVVALYTRPAHMLDDMRVFCCGERMTAKQK